MLSCENGRAAERYLFLENPRKQVRTRGKKLRRQLPISAACLPTFARTISPEHKPRHMNFFAFFNLPVAFQIDEPALKRAFLLNSRKFHPDFHTLADDAQQTEMLELSSLNNEAYKTLADPDRRMQHVLEIKNLLADEGENKLPQDFLMEMMDINEAIMELEFDPSPVRLAEAQQTTQHLENQLFAAAKPILENWRDGASDDAELLALRDFFFKKRYLLRAQENLSKFAADFEGAN